MRKSLNVIVQIVLVTCAALMPGCADRKERAASRKIVEAIDEAQRRYDRGLALLANPVIKVGDQFVPVVPKKDAPAGVPEPEVVPVLNALNPLALTALNEAEDVMAKAVAANPEAGPAEKALADRTRGRIAVAKAYYYSRLAAMARGEVMAILPGAETNLSQIETRAALMVYYRKLLSLPNDDVQAMLDSAGTDQKQFAAKVGELKGKIAANEQLKQQLNESGKARMEEARKIRVESRLAGGQKGLDLLRKALDIEAAVNKDNSKVDAAEAESISLKVELADYELQLAASNQQIQMAKEILQGRETAAGEVKKQLDAATQELAGVVKKLEEATGRIGGACETASVAETASAEAYEKARKHLEGSRSFPLHKSDQAMAEEADVLVARGEMNAARLELQTRLTRLTDRMEKLLPQALPGSSLPSLEKIKGYVPKLAEVKESAEKDFREATNLYKKALAAMKSEYRWVCQGQVAAAYLGLYNLTRDSADLEAAKSAAGEALKGREQSPYASDLKDLENIANRK